MPAYLQTRLHSSDSVVFVLLLLVVLPNVRLSPDDTTVARSEGEVPGKVGRIFSSLPRERLRSWLTYLLIASPHRPARPTLLLQRSLYATQCELSPTQCGLQMTKMACQMIRGACQTIRARC